MPGLYKLYLATIFRCTHQGCAFFSETKHGMHTHDPRQQRQSMRSKFVEIDVLPVISLHRVYLVGRGNRLRVDRVTYSTKDPALDVQEQLSYDLRISCSAFPPLPRIE